MHGIIPYLTVFLFGSVVGSFLNVCIYRIPRGLSIIVPSSRCSSCNIPIRPWDNIPILSYIFLGGRCRACKARISSRYPLVELLNAVFYVVVLWRFGFGWHTPVYSVFCSALIVITFIDLDFQIIPNGITLPGIPIGIILGGFLLLDPFMRHLSLGIKSSLTGASIGFGFYYLVAKVGARIFKKEAMGGGDIKLMAMVGGFLGWKGVILTTFLGSLSGAIIGVLLILLKGREWGSKIPFGPYLALGSVITLFYGQEILSWYLGRQTT
ncbi:MAG: prepilin peptidase [Thermodesulfovibrionales bacterium]|nr:prepilin peptidase [Thermodesulfovibrionales bacterium]